MISSHWGGLSLCVNTSAKGMANHRNSSYMLKDTDSVWSSTAKQRPSVELNSQRLRLLCNALMLCTAQTGGPSATLPDTAFMTPALHTCWQEELASASGKPLEEATPSTMSPTKPLSSACVASLCSRV